MIILIHSYNFQRDYARLYTICIHANFIFFYEYILRHTDKNYFNTGIIVSKIEIEAVIHSLRDSVTDRSNSYENCKLKCRKVSASCTEGHWACDYSCAPIHLWTFGWTKWYSLSFTFPCTNNRECTFRVRCLWNFNVAGLAVPND